MYIYPIVMIRCFSFVNYAFLCTYKALHLLNYREILLGSSPKTANTLKTHGGVSLLCRNQFESQCPMLTCAVRITSAVKIIRNYSSYEGLRVFHLHSFTFLHANLKGFQYFFSPLLSRILSLKLTFIN